MVTEYLAASGIDRHDSSAVSRAAQHLHDGAAGGGRTLARADDGNALGREEGREIAGIHGRLFAAQTMRENKMADPIELLIQGRAHELGPGFAVRRVLPSVKRRMVGPFIFLDHFGPMVVPHGIALLETNDCHGTPARSQAAAKMPRPAPSVAYRWLTLTLRIGPPLGTGWWPGSWRSA